MIFTALSWWDKIARVFSAQLDRTVGKLIRCLTLAVKVCQVSVLMFSCGSKSSANEKVALSGDASIEEQRIDAEKEKIVISVLDDDDAKGNRQRPREIVINREISCSKNSWSRKSCLI